MNNIDQIVSAFEQDKGYVLEGLAEHLELLDTIVSDGAGVSWSNRLVLYEYLEPKSEEEFLQLVRHVMGFMNRVEMCYYTSITKAYSQIEAAFSSIVKISENYPEYKKKYGNKKGSSELGKMYNFIVEDKRYLFKATELKLIEFVDNEVREERNRIVHELHKLTSQDDAIKFIGDGINLHDKLQMFYQEYANNIFHIYGIFEYVITICKKIWSVYHERSNLLNH
ncbi:hypothetical protein [Cohnella sp. GbtcB17]|uniref:hypothetical protein n=1 Tax=Cohnella sp. GbtcB17 TaxID=2824762 RepID=UPI001C30E50F|nr:hypothetical protein [Cohnella sp. GbtcB17]